MTDCPIEPKYNHFVIVQDEAKGFDSDVLVTPDLSKERPPTGLVVATNPPNHDWLGATVIFRKYSGVEYKVGGVEYIIISLDDVIGAVRATQSESAGRADALASTT